LLPFLKFIQPFLPKPEVEFFGGWHIHQETVQGLKTTSCPALETETPPHPHPGIHLYLKARRPKPLYLPFSFTQKSKNPTSK
jgi:hypothetical protein